MDREQEQRLLGALQQAVISGDDEKTEQLSKKAIKEGMALLLALEEGLGKGIMILGDAFSAGEAFLPELLIGADTLKAGANILTEEFKSRGTPFCSHEFRNSLILCSEVIPMLN